MQYELDFTEAGWTPCEKVPHDKTVLLARQEAGKEVSDSGS